VRKSGSRLTICRGGLLMPDRRGSWYCLSLSAVIVLAAYSVPCRSAQAQTVELILQDPLEFDRPADRCESDLCTSLVALIDDAASSINFAIYGARNQSAIMNSVVRARNRGVRIRGYVDRDAEGENYYTSTESWVHRIGNIRDDEERELRCRESIEPTDLKCQQPRGFTGPLQCSAYRIGDRFLAASHAAREPFGQVNQIMHHKFFVIDEEHVWTGSANISDSGTGGYNANAVLIIHSAKVARAYLNEFEQVWNREHSTCNKTPEAPAEFVLGDSELVVMFSPQDRTVYRGVSTLIARARHRINVGVFFLTSKQLAADLIAAHQRGVKVRVIVDATAAKNGYTKHEILREAGILVKIENWGGKMHMKSASIDGEVLIGGSMNWTSAGEWTNDENSLLIRSARLAAQFDDYYDRIWDSIPAHWQRRNARPDPESAQSGHACRDGVDNDFDGLVDADDPGCSAVPPPLPELPPHRWLSTTHYRDFSDEYRVAWPKRCLPDYRPWYVCRAPSKTRD